MKHKLTILAVMMMALAIPQSVKAYQFSYTYQGQTLYYNIVDDNAEVTYPGTNYYPYINPTTRPTGSLEIPSTVSNGTDTYSVTSIGDNAFINCTGLTSVTIPNSLTAIGGSAFRGCSGMTSITISDSVAAIGEYAFADCTGLTSITIPNSVTYIGLWTFSGCSGLTSVTIPNSFTYINEGMFYGCNGLTSINIPNSVTAIGTLAFGECNGLISITIPNSVTAIGEEAFGYCSGLTSVVFNADSCTTAGNQNNGAFVGSTNIATVTFGENVKMIPDYLFSYDWPFDWPENLDSVVIPNSVIVIGNEAFKGTRLTSVNIPNSVTTIGNGAFQETSLTSLALGDGVTYIGDNAFAGTQINTVVIPENVTYIGSGAFNVEASPTYTMMSATAPTIGNNAFTVWRYCTIQIPCGSFDSYYNGTGWTNYRGFLREPAVEITMTALSDNYFMGSASARMHNVSVTCDSMTVIEATPRYGYQFSHWSNGSIANPDTLHLTGDSSVTAFFVPRQFTLSLTSADESLGTVDGGGSYNYLDTVTFVATPVPHHHFLAWNDGNRDNPRQVVIESDTAFTAMFAVDTYTVAVAVNDIARGSVSASGTEFVYATPCTVEATAYTGYTFAGWSNGVTETPYTFAVMENTVLTAIFLAPGEVSYTVTVVSADPTMGTVSGGGQAMDGGTVTIRATSNPGYHFVRWNDDNTDSVRTVEVHADVTYTAYFAANVGIDDVATSEIRMYSCDGEIVLEGSEGQAVSVYDMMGRKVFSMAAAPDPCRVAVLQRGVYLVKVGNLPARKVVVVR